ncbi:MAG: cell division protein ZapA [Natronospirillum sp.]|uniref:cell division protein ZapA n=1 Tax=Natronospirillum sp. TaxID=2812955 RepID=UPI0025D6D317|nr:cell division protein ZapA [Natronospirillum sp.]MCH8551444.1 cell division protein ZapA [Natronospirillum sp.]
MKHQNTVQVHILDREYTVSCPPEAEAELRAAARQLHDKMTEIRHSGKVFGVERLSVMAALNLIHELRTELQATQVPEETLDRLLGKLDTALDSEEETR